MRKSGAQLQREIDEALARRPGAAGPLPKFEPGQRVDVLTYTGEMIPGKHVVVDGSRWGLDESRFVRVRRLFGGGSTTEDWPIDRVRPRR